MKYICICLGVWLATLLAAPTQVRAENAPERSITIMADPSLTVVVSLIARQYALKHDVAITTIFSSTPSQIKQIKEGDASNVIISARPEWIDEMQQNGLIDVFSRRNIARNNLVLAGSRFNFKQPNMKQATSISAFNANAEDFMFAIGNPLLTAEGNYAVQALESYKLNQMLEPHYVFVGSASEVVNMIEQHDAIGVLFRTDAQLFYDVKEIEAFTADAHSPLIYQAAAVVGENMEQARSFIAYLNGADARNIFREYGFSTFF